MQKSTSSPSTPSTEQPKPTALDVIAADHHVVLALLHAIGGEEHDTVLQALEALETDLETLADTVRTSKSVEVDHTLLRMAFRAKAIGEVHRALSAAWLK